MCRGQQSQHRPVSLGDDDNNNNDDNAMVNPVEKEAEIQGLQAQLQAVAQDYALAFVQNMMLQAQKQEAEAKLAEQDAKLAEIDAQIAENKTIVAEHTARIAQLKETCTKHVRSSMYRSFLYRLVLVPLVVILAHFMLPSPMIEEGKNIISVWQVILIWVVYDGITLKQNLSGMKTASSDDQDNALRQEANAVNWLVCSSIGLLVCFSWFIYTVGTMETLTALPFIYLDNVLVCGFVFCTAFGLTAGTGGGAEKEELAYCQKEKIEKQQHQIGNNSNSNTNSNKPATEMNVAAAPETAVTPPSTVAATAAEVTDNSEEGNKN